MKKIIFVLLIAFSLPAAAQEETLISGNIESGGFGGPVVKMTTINGENAILVGGRGGWIINHSFILGAGGYGLVTDVDAKVTDSVHQFVEMGYGGIELEYIASSNDLVHLSVGVLVGGGGIGYKREDSDAFNSPYKKNAFFVLEPNANVNLNVTRFFRIAAGISYRYVSGLKSVVSTNNDLSGPSGVLTFKFGKF